MEIIFPDHYYFHYTAPNADEFIDRLECEYKIDNTDFPWVRDCNVDVIRLGWQEYFGFLTPSLDLLTKDIGGNITYSLCDPWLNLYKKGGFQEVHDHKDADIASVSAGADVGNFAPTTGIPPGIVYTHLRVTISRTFTVTASISVGAGLCRTDGGDNATATQMTVGATSGTAVAETMYLVNAGSYGASDGTRDGDVGSSNLDIDYSSPSSAKSMTVSGDTAVMTYELTSPYQKTLRAPVIKVKFNTSTAVGVEDTACSMWVNEPSVTISLQ